jgi:hypothetical protein
VALPGILLPLVLKAAQAHQAPGAGGPAYRRAAGATVSNSAGPGPAAGGASDTALLTSKLHVSLHNSEQPAQHLAATAADWAVQ